MSQTPTITILGTGYAGLTTAAIFAAAGIQTYVVDPNAERLDSVRSGKSFFYEEGLDPVIADTVKKGTLVPTPAYEDCVPKSDIIISAVGTPDNPDGSSNLRYVFAAAAEAARFMRPDAVYVQKSTVPVGTGQKVQAIFDEAGIHNAYVSNPEFLKEGTALQDSLWFDRVVVGGSDSAAMERVLAVYRHVEQARDAVAALAGVRAPAKQPIGTFTNVNLESAELIKVVSNTFLALKISFANSVAQLADKAGADVVEVLDAVGADTRIGRAFLHAGRGYGGGCIPKDVSGLIAAGLERGVDLEIMRAVQHVNEAMPGYTIEKLQDALGGSLAGHTIAVLGLSFKAGTSDCRRSSAIAIANTLVERGAQVAAHDPQSNTEAAVFLEAEVRLAADIAGAVQGADAVIVATDWPEFTSVPPETYAGMLGGRIFVDAMNRFDIKAVADAGLQYIGVGRSASA